MPIVRKYITNTVKNKKINYKQLYINSSKRLEKQNELIKILQKKVDDLTFMKLTSSKIYFPKDCY